MTLPREISLKARLELIWVCDREALAGELEGWRAGAGSWEAGGLEALGESTAIRVVVLNHLRSAAHDGWCWHKSVVRLAV